MESVKAVSSVRCFFCSTLNTCKSANNTDNNIKPKLILSADDTSLVVTNPNSTEFIKDINVAIKNINIRFKSNLL